MLLKAAALAGTELATVTAQLDDGQEPSALNEVFVGYSSHQSARYQLITPGGKAELQSSSGLIISTGTGANWLVRLHRRRTWRACLVGTG